MPKFRPAGDRDAAFLSALPALFLAGTAIAQSVPDKPSCKAGGIVLEKATAQPAGGNPVEFELGTLTVPENRSESKSRLIGVGFARFKAKKLSDAPPIFMLPGGPGNSFLRGLKPGGTSPGLLRQIERYRGAADVVLVDQRGFSERGEVLVHRYRMADEPLDKPASIERETRAFVERAREAVRAFAERKIDLRGYTVIECADDVDELRRALGYERITLVGTSFGSQWSFAIMRRHPERVARALLTGVEPLDYGYDMPSHIAAALGRIWFAAEQDSRFRPFLPPGGFAAAAREVIARLEKEPVRVTLPGPTNSGGDPPTITLGVDDFRRDPLLRSTDGPAFILSLYHGHFGPWAQSVYRQRRSRGAELAVISPSIDTSLGVTPRRRYLLENDPAVALLGRWNFDAYLASAEVWPSADVGDEFRAETVTETPVVFLQGNWDLQTPLENALSIAPYFPHGHLILVERGVHGVLGQVERSRPETMAALVRFLGTGETKGLPVRIDVPAPMFAVPGFSVVK